MAQAKDIFFSEFFEELVKELNSVVHEDFGSQPDPEVAEMFRSRWHPYSPSDSSSFVPVAVDGGIQHSSFSDGWMVSVARACALICHPERGSGPEIVKNVKVQLGRIFGGDRTYVQSYVRMITEYRAAHAAAEKVLSEGGTPLVLMDGSLYLGRFPYAEREYLSHARLLTELFNSIARLHALSTDHAFPLVGMSKDSTVFHLYMALLREHLLTSPRGDEAIELLSRSTSPISFRNKLRKAGLPRSSPLFSIQSQWPSSDTRLVEVSNTEAGFSHPLLLAPSIYYRRGDSIPSIHRRIRNLLSADLAGDVLRAFDEFFSRPTTGLVYWRPPRSSRAFRLDVSGSCLGDTTPLRDVKSNIFLSDSADLTILRNVLNTLNRWYCNDLEYDLPLHQSDRLARFDNALYRSHYEPYIMSEMQKLGFVPGSRVRDLRS